MAQKEPYDYIFKILLLGEINCGRLSLLRRFFRLNSTLPFTGVVVMTKTIDGKKIRLQIWDTNGGERFNPNGITSSYWRGDPKGCVVVYDITNERSINNVQGWVEAIRKNANVNVQILLLGNNCHLEDERQITKERGEQLAREHGTNFLEASAETGHNVEECFMSLARDIKKQIESKQETMKETKMEQREVCEPSCKSARAYLPSKDPSDRRFRCELN